MLSLTIKSNEMTHAIADDLSQAVIDSNLEYLDISGNNLGNSGILKFCSVLQYAKCSLRILKIKDLGFT